METQKLKVLHIHTRGIVGGSGTNTLLSMEGLPRDRFLAMLGCGCEGPLAEEARKNNLKVAILPHLRNQINPWNDFIALFEIIGLINKEKFAIVHTHNSKAGILGRCAAKICRVPVIVHTLHSCVFKYPNLNWLQRKFFFFLEKLTAGFCDKLIVISEPLRQEFIRAHVAAPQKFITIYSGIETEKFQLRLDTRAQKQELGIPEGKIVVGIISRLAEGKGHEFVMQAIPHVLKEASNTAFVFVGDGPIRNHLEDFASQLGVRDKVIFTGTRNDAAQILQAFDVFCLASLYEGMGRVILEAQAAGKPVVATRVGGIPDIVLEGKTAFLVEPGDSVALAQALLKLIKDDNLRKAMSQEAKEFVGIKFSAEKMVADIIKVYEELLNKKLKL